MFHTETTHERAFFERGEYSLAGGRVALAAVRLEALDFGEVLGVLFVDVAELTTHGPELVQLAPVRSSFFYFIFIIFLIDHLLRGAKTP